MTEGEMVGWHYRFNGHEFGQTPADGEGQEDWHAAVHEVTKNCTQLNNKTFYFSTISNLQRL